MSYQGKRRILFLSIIVSVLIIFFIFVRQNQAIELENSLDHISLQINSISPNNNSSSNPLPAPEEMLVAEELELPMEYGKGNLADLESPKVEHQLLFEQEEEPPASDGMIDLAEVEILGEREYELRPLEEIPVVEDPKDSRPFFVSHRIQTGETLWEIARLYGVDVDTILGTNPDLKAASYLRVGDSLTIPAQKGILHEVYGGETLWDLSRIYGVTIDSIREINQLGKGDFIRTGQQLFIPGASSTQRPVRYIWPVQGCISSPFGYRWGRMHEGVDIAVNVGTEVRASRSGRVILSSYVGGYGYAIYIDHGDGVSTRYAHNSRLLVSRGEYVSQGQVIALSGNTGVSTGPHLHFEIRIGGQPVDPLPYLRR